MKCSRRDFVALCGSALVTACSSTSGGWYRAEMNQQRELVVPLSAFDDDGVAIVEHAELSVPIAVVRCSDGALVASVMKCTHAGCPVDRSGAKLVCYCHGSEFSLEGGLLQGPADRDLDRLHAYEEGGLVLITPDVATNTTCGDA